MSRMDARCRNASALWFRFSQSLASRRQRFSQAMVLSTIQRCGSTTKPLALVAAFDDLNPKVRHHVGGSVPKHRPGIGAVGKQLAKERKLPKQRGQQQDAAIAVLHVGGGYQRMQKETELCRRGCGASCL